MPVVVAIVGIDIGNVATILSVCLRWKASGNSESPTFVDKSTGTKNAPGVARYERLDLLDAEQLHFEDERGAARYRALPGISVGRI